MPGEWPAGQHARYGLLLRYVVVWQRDNPVGTILARHEMVPSTPAHLSTDSAL